MALAILLAGGVAAADDGNGDIPPQPSAMGQGIADIMNAIKHATTDVAQQDQADDLQMAKLQKSLGEQLKKLQAARKQVEAQQTASLNASVKVSKSQDESKEQHAADLKTAADDLKAADNDLNEAQKLVTHEIQRIASVQQIKSAAKKAQMWESERKAMQAENVKVMGYAQSATAKLNAADELIKKAGGSSSSSDSEAIGAFKVTLKAWSCKKTELYFGDAKEATKVGGSTGASKDGKLTMRVMLVDARRQQARKFAHERETGKYTTKNVHVTAASNWILSYELEGGKKTDWRVEKEEYEWKAPEGKQQVNHKESSSPGANGKLKNDRIEITFPTAAATNTVHGWVRGEIEWKGAQTENDTEDCSYDLSIAPNH